MAIAWGSLVGSLPYVEGVASAERPYIVVRF